MITIDVELIESYRAECAEQLAIMEKSVLALELGGAEGTPELASRATRAAHSVKAGADLLGFGQIAELAERIEKALSALRFNRAALKPEQVTVLLNVIDTLRDWIDDPNASEGADVSEIAHALAGLPSGTGPVVPARRPERLRTLLVEDDFTGRMLLQTFLSRYGECHVAVNGKEAVEAFRATMERGESYDLICMDIMMPEMDGNEAMRQIRAIEEEKGVFSTEGTKIIMTTAMSGMKDVSRSFWNLCDAYLVKPIDLGQLLACLKSCDLIT
jgi:two-component system chemotaxis response regulator CheY